MPVCKAPVSWCFFFCSECPSIHSRRFACHPDMSAHTTVHVYCDGLAKENVQRSVLRVMLHSQAIVLYKQMPLPLISCIHVACFSFFTDNLPIHVACLMVFACLLVFADSLSIQIVCLLFFPERFHHHCYRAFTLLLSCSLRTDTIHSRLFSFHHHISLISCSFCTDATTQAAIAPNQLAAPHVETEDRSRASPTAAWTDEEKDREG